jgi:putative transposase
MRYPASDKLEIIRLVEQSHLPAGRALEKLGILRSTFYRWSTIHAQLQRFGMKGWAEEASSHQGSVRRY